MFVSHRSKKRLRALAEKLLDREKGKKVQEVALFLGYQLKEELQKKISTSHHKLSGKTNEPHRFLTLLLDIHLLPCNVSGFHSIHKDIRRCIYMYTYLQAVKLG